MGKSFGVARANFSLCQNDSVLTAILAELKSYLLCPGHYFEDEHEDEEGQCVFVRQLILPGLRNADTSCAAECRASARP